MQTTNYERPEWVDSDLFPFESRWIGIEGHQIHFIDEGPSNAPVILFLHDGLGWSFTYRYHIKRLSRNFRCVAPDFPGYGLSEAAEGYSFTLMEQSHVIEKFVESLDLKDIVVWANDGGGPTAVLALARHQERVVGLVVGGTFGWSLSEYPTVSRMLRLVSGEVFRFVNRYSNILPKVMVRMGLGTRSLSKRERLHYVRPFKDRKTRNRTLKLFRSFLDPATQNELRSRLPAFRDKVALIQFGKRDPMTDQGWPERWAREIPENRVHILPGARHFTFEDAPETTVQNFLAWWTDLKSLVGSARPSEGVPENGDCQTQAGAAAYGEALTATR